MCNSQVEGCGACSCASSWAFRGLNARHSGENEAFHGHVEGKRSEADRQRGDRSEQSEENGSLPLRLGVQKVVVLMQTAVG